ncbi:hypothetical protein GH714_017891 [Hevea brasiliensis]|uniref:Uncharacterized protein n=1 Tax=Hevea brasiliensis TaxID=3981 RepID=A0A6A6LTN1_HEVBR|nr:hypothetical protein GH714_017891 [Hevea brasiliensis]
MLNLEAVASDMEELAESLKSISISHNSLVGAVDDIKEDVRETVKIIQGELHELEGKQTGSIRKYVREFSTLMLNIKDMTGTDRLFNFVKGLKPWARNELMRQNVKELKTALAIAESLDDYSTDTSIRKFDSSPSLDNHPKWGKTSSGGVNKDYSPFKGTKRATDNFIANRAALQFQLNMQEDKGKIKAVNSKATNIVGVARRVSYQMGSWNGEIDFTVIPLDDFDVVIGMEFLKKALAIPIPIVDYLVLMGEKPCIVPTNFNPFVKRN